MDAPDTAAPTRRGNVRALLHDLFRSFDGRGSAPSGALTSTGFFAWDAFTAGLQPGELSLIAGAPASGKTALALSVASAFLREGRPVLYLTTEVSETALLERLLCAWCDIDSLLLRRMQIQRPDMVRVTEVTDALSRVPLTIRSMLTQLTVAAAAEAAVQWSGDLGDVEAARPLLVVDNVQMFRSPDAVPTGSRLGDVTRTVHELKSLAFRLRLPVLATSHVVRNHEPGAIELSDLKESGELEATADVVLAIQGQTSDRPPGVTRISLLKQRSGPVGEFELLFRPAWSRFDNIQGVAPGQSP